MDKRLEAYKSRVWRGWAWDVAFWPPPWELNSPFRRAASLLWPLAMPLVFVVALIAMLVCMLWLPIGAIVSKLTGRGATTVRNRADVCQTIEDFVNGSGGSWNWDDFLSVTDFDPVIEHVRRRCADVGERFPPEKPGQWCGPRGLDELRRIAQELREFIEDDPVTWPVFIKVKYESDLLFISDRQEWDVDIDLSMDPYDVADRLIDSTGATFMLRYPEGARPMSETTTIAPTGEFLGADEVKQLMLEHLDYHKRPSADYLSRTEGLGDADLIRETIQYGTEAKL